MPFQKASYPRGIIGATFLIQLTIPSGAVDITGASELMHKSFDIVSYAQAEVVFGMTMNPELILIHHGSEKEFEPVQILTELWTVNQSQEKTPSAMISMVEMETQLLKLDIECAQGIRLLQNIDW